MRLEGDQVIFDNKFMKENEHLANDIELICRMRIKKNT